VANGVPFFGAFVGIPHVDLNTVTGIQKVVFNGVGVAWKMDDVTCHSTDEVAYPYPVMDPRTQTPTMMSATYTICGDDGDSLVIWITTPPEKYLFNQATGHLDFSGTFVVIGGTGRYRSATGSGAYAGYADAAPDNSAWVKDGELHIGLVGQGQWALWGTLFGVRGEPCHGR